MTETDDMTAAADAAITIKPKTQEKSYRPPFRRRLVRSKSGRDIPPYPTEPDDPCRGCGNWFGPCVWPCCRAMGYHRFPQTKMAAPAPEPPYIIQWKE